MAELDKSATHQRVIKNGTEGWIVKEIWTEMVKNKDTNGFEAVSSEPPEVSIIKKKKVKEEVAVEVASENTEAAVTSDAPVIDESLVGKKKSK
jgi:hypothetical protein